MSYTRASVKNLEWRVLVMKHEDMSLGPRAGEVETGGWPGLTASQPSLTDKLQSNGALSLRRGLIFLRMTPEVDLWPLNKHVHSCMYR